MSGLDRLGPVPVGISWWLDNGELGGINPKLIVFGGFPFFNGQKSLHPYKNNQESVHISQKEYNTPYSRKGVYHRIKRSQSSLCVSMQRSCAHA